MKEAEYGAQLNCILWKYARRHIPLEALECAETSGYRPPVLLQGFEDQNVLSHPTDSRVAHDVLNSIARSKRHRWFRSLKSSQALAQSVFGNLIRLQQLEVLSPLLGDDGRSIFAVGGSLPLRAGLEYEIDYLREAQRGRTSVDLMIDQHFRTAVEVKFTESDIGRCSRPELRPTDKSFPRDYCDGNYVVQRGRAERCSLSEQHIRYWELVPMLFTWKDDIDHQPCPLRTTYQLMRNILAAACQPGEDGVLRIDPERARVVLVFDDRNPAFQSGGDGCKAYEALKEALLLPEILQRCTWQSIAAQISRIQQLDWLANGLSEKYGFV